MMKVVFCLSFCVLGVLANAVEKKIPAAEPKHLDALLAQKRYEEFSYLMDLGDPQLAYAKDQERTEDPFTLMMNEKLDSGDIVLSSKEREEARQGINFERYRGSQWPNGQVPYAISDDFNDRERAIILNGIQSWNNQVNCIKFRPRTDDDEDYTLIFSGQGCYSMLGRRGGQQPLSLQKNGCLYESTVLHELEHAIGIHHEHNRSDRDDYIRMIWENIPRRWRSQYQKTNPRDFGLQATYDYYSVMHYPVNAPGTRRPAYEVLQEGIDENRIGRGTGFTQTDLQKISELYC